MILFKKSGFYIEEDGKVEPMESDLGVLSHIRDDFGIDAGDPPTLQDFVTWLRSLGEDLLFIEMYTGAQVRPYLETLRAPEPDDDAEALVGITVSTRVPEIDDYDGQAPGDFEFGRSSTCSGVTAAGEHEAIEFTPWEKLLSVPLILDPRVHVVQTLVESRRRHPARCRRRQVEIRGPGADVDVDVLPQSRTWLRRLAPGHPRRDLLVPGPRDPGPRVPGPGVPAQGGQGAPREPGAA